MNIQARMICGVAGLMLAVGHVMAAPIVVTPGTNAGYMYFPQTSVGGGGGSGGSSTPINVSVTASGVSQASPQTASQAGTCATASTIGQACTWGDGWSFKYAGMLGSKKLFAENVPYDPQIQWGCYGVTTGAQSETDGMSNTNLVVLVDSALGGCKYNSGGITYQSPPVAHLFCASKNMYLPDKNELQVLYDNRTAIGGFFNLNYWSSTEYNNNHAWHLYFYVGSWGSNNKTNTYAVRCVRSF